MSNKDTEVQIVHLPPIPKDQVDFLKSLQLAAKEPDWNEVIEDDVYVTESLGVDACPLCDEEMLESYVQCVFVGPRGERTILGGSIDPQYLRYEPRQECSGCGTKFWKVNLAVLAKL